MNFERHLVALAHESGALAAAARSSLSSPVPACPDWTVEALVAHVGHGFRVVTGIVRDHADAEVSFSPVRAPSSDVVEWFEESVTELVETLTTSGPEAPCWNWSGQDRRAAFWARRMAHEVAVHRWDVEHAAGSPAPIEPELAVDGVDEMLTVHLQHYLDEHPLDDLAGTFAVVASDTEDAWFGRLRPDSADVVRGTPASLPGATLRGTASDLVLAMWGRPVTVEGTGDARIVGLLTE